MRKALITTALLIGGAFCFQPVAFGHGGTYRGPGDTVPPGGGGGGGGGGTPATPGSGAPASPSPASPGAPAPATPGSPAGGPGGAATPTTGSFETGPDLTVWSFWWEFNKDPFINLKAAINSGGTQTGSSDWFLGQGTDSQAKDSMRPSQSDIDNKIVPALLKALETETNNDIITGSMMALAKIGDKPDENGRSAFAEKFTEFLGDSNQEIAETSAIALGILANDASVKTLQDLLADTSAGRKLVGSNEVSIRTRSFAAYGLALVGSRTASPETRVAIIQSLRESLESDDTATRDIKVACLIAMGLVPLEKLGTEADAAPLEEDAVLMLDTRMAQIDYLTEYFQGGEHYLVRSHCPTAIARLLGETAGDESFDIKKEEVARVFLKTLKSKERNPVIQSCVLALGQLGDADPDGIDAEIRKGLIGVPKDVTDTQARNFSVIALAQAASRVSGGDPTDAIKEASKHFQTQLSKGKSAIRPWTGVAIGVFGRGLGEAAPVDVVEALRSQLIEERTPRIGAYAIGSGILGNPDFTETLLDKMDRIKEDEPRGYICVSLGMIGASEAIVPINEIVKNSTYRPQLLQQASIALGLLGDKNVVDDLIDTLGKSKSLATQAALSAALGYIGDKRSIDPLVEMLGNSALTTRARGFAAVALGIVADKEDLPWNSKIALDLNYRASTQTLNDTGGTGILNIL